MHRLVPYDLVNGDKPKPSSPPNGHPQELLHESPGYIPKQFTGENEEISIKPKHAISKCTSPVVARLEIPISLPLIPLHPFKLCPRFPVLAYIDRVIAVARSACTVLTR